MLLAYGGENNNENSDEEQKSWQTVWFNKWDSLALLFGTLSAMNCKEDYIYFGHEKTYTEKTSYT